MRIQKQATARDPWERRENEGLKAYAAFLAYRNLTPVERSVVRAYRQHTGRAGAETAPGLWNGWSVRHQWVFRADQWDAHLQGLVDEQIRKMAREGAEQDTAIVRGLLAVTGAAVRILQAQFRPAIEALSRNEPLPANVPQVTLASAATLAEMSVKLHRLLQGEVTERAETIQGESVEVSQAREEIERRLTAIAARMARAGLTSEG